MNLPLFSSGMGTGLSGIVLRFQGANGQGKTMEECRENLSAAIALILEDRRQEALRGVPPDAIRDVVVVA